MIIIIIIIMVSENMRQWLWSGDEKVSGHVTVILPPLLRNTSYSVWLAGKREEMIMKKSVTNSMWLAETVQVFL